MSEADARPAGPGHAGRLLDAGQVRAYRGPSLVLFLGISTAGSLAHRIFPGWSQLFCPGAVMRGADLPADASPAEFRDLVAAMTANPRVLGAVGTSHKLRLVRACQDLVGYAEPLVRRGAKALFLKGQDVEAELTEATKYWNIKPILHSSLTGGRGWIVELDRIDRRNPGGNSETN